MIKNDFAEIKNGTLKLSKKEAVIIPDDVKRLRALISSYIPKIKIEELLIEVDKMTNFSRCFIPLHGQKGKPDNYYKTLIASIISQATNLGIVSMQDCTTDITVEMMRYAPRESLYVIDGLLGNNTILSIKEHTTDTEGYTEHIFALCYLLGIEFMP